jgi:NAD(P)H-hydrate epimerase
MTIKVFTVEEMVAAERAADAAGTSYEEMMENAGRAVAMAIAERYAVEDREVLVLVGPGNNGGDGLVAGRYLADRGAQVAFYLFKERDAAEDKNFAAIQEMDLFHVNAAFDQRYRVLRLRLRGTDLLIDALLGTGVSRPIGGELAAMMRQVQAGLEERRTTAVEEYVPSLTVATDLDTNEKQHEPVVVAVDCPSGLNTNSGELDPLAIPADLTVTFAGPKRGHFIFPGAAAVGELVIADIGIGNELPEVQSVPVELAHPALARRLLPTRPLDGHKGTFGKVLIAAGSEDYWGAPVLCGLGAYRAGAGLVALAVPRAVRPVVAGQLVEATYPALPDADNLSAEGARHLLQQMEGYDALLIGPGIGEAREFVATLLQEKEQLPPLVVDAGGLNILAQMEEWAQRLPPNSILTPHPGEMARLMGISLSELKERDRLEIASEMGAAWGQIVVLKGAYTVVAAPDGRCTLQPFANPLLGAAGSGDVLGGIIVSLLGQGLEPYDAAVLGAYVHGAAGELAAEEVGDAGLLSGELADWVPEVRQRLSE